MGYTHLSVQNSIAPNDEHLAKFRSRFAILREKAYFYSCSQGALSDAVEEGMRAYAASWRSSSAPWDEWVGVYEALRREFASFIHAHPDEVAIATSASAAISAIASALTFEQRNKIVMGEYEFPTMGHIWLAQQSRGAAVQFLKGVDGRIPLEAYERAIDERTNMVPVTQVSFLNGNRADPAAIANLAHARGALAFLDGYQDCGTRPMDVKALDVDFFVTGALKYLLGPPGVAFLYVKRELVASLTPTVTSWLAQRDVFAFDTQRYDPAPAARRFEGGSPSVPNIYMSRPALQLLIEFGMEQIATQIERLSRAFLQGIQELGLQTKTEASTIGPLVVVRSIDPAQAIAKLMQRGVVASARHDGLRFSFHAYNTMDDVRIALEALKENLALLART
ncbi:MAG TPA: aminotransferase class V-fold PLP-dependent enzyme [Bryobacteraceae bacterium]|jgi:selenocysteine lyase/cysteine desulfurase|nr:aminotransferase class V-fold PLP-dependent enzyme [Bryobacteraceae bacterium]